MSDDRKNRGARFSRGFLPNEPRDPSLRMAPTEKMLSLVDSLEIKLTDTKGYLRTDALVVKSSKKYTSFLDNLWRFCERIGHYADMFMLLVVPVDQCPPIDPKTLLLYWKFKDYVQFYQKPIPLSDGTGGYLRDASNDEDILGDGGWSSKSAFTVGHGIIATLHSRRGHGGAYTPVCDDCRDLFSTSVNRSGCNHHAGRACLFASGCPTHAVKFADYHKKLMAEFSRDGYQEKSKSYIGIDHLTLMLNSYLTENTIAGLRNYVMVVIAIHIFNR